jgi:hypothetical protein
MVADLTVLGLGNEQAFVTLTGYGTVKAPCENKGDASPGRNPIKMNVTETDEFVTDSNGAL